MRYLLISVTILLLLTGCTMHPPSTAAFMDAMESSYETHHSVRAEYSQYDKKEDGWDSPVAYDFLKSSNGTVWGFGFQPSPYITFGTGNDYAAVRGWLSMPWALGIAVIVCPVCFIDTDDDDEEYDDYWSDIDDEKKDVDYVGAIEDLFGAFAGGISIIQQLPIGDVFRIGVEEYITRNVWIPRRDNEEKSTLEAGFGAYINFRFENFSVGIDAHYGFLDFNPNRERFAISANVSLRRKTQH
ncbi:MULTISPECIES: hypothetical protein [unclassified Fibrobacter]|uniref:hypothetical protein n=1 Tax=unclassified Fibrobacter TaxID=2634177 RepID=UPI000D791E44|nr:MULTISPECIES: hypothetical protein [unclassified Fibrobacter]PWJ62510.1 hypothetical protein BGX12_12112 [Fibrobacter sp. UWR4]PZW67363.1 hypothetical protein C8E88_102639 [Fibrobacter sp. UWR1]